MRKIYINSEGKQVARPHSLTFNDTTYCPPTDELLIQAGWEIEEVIDPIPEPYIPTLEELVEQKIRTRYSINQEFQVNRKRDVEPDAFAEYNTFVEECIKEAEAEPHRD